ncbi:MAG: hypothetical protein EXS16_19050 [Gemmataceae bacterium]|nr:hypothetical protein [Gemmataceae bacterium]
MRMKLSVAGFTCLLGLGLVTGCGDNLAEVKGTVKFDGKLVESGAIRFVAADGSSPAKGGVITKGEYHVKVPPGEMKVSFTATHVTGKKALYDKPEGPFMGVRVNMVPEKYADDKSELRHTVVRGVNQKDWDLSSK